MSYGTIDSTAQTSQIAESDIGQSLHTNVDAQDQSEWKNIQQRLSAFYDRNLGLFLVFLAQTCGSLVCLMISYLLFCQLIKICR